jgi:hypothetical protein
MDVVGDPPAVDPGSRPPRVSPVQATAAAARAVQESMELRRRLVGLADAIALVLEEHATVHERMAGQAGMAEAGVHATRSRELAAAERAVAQAYRDGTRPSDTVRGTIRG